MEELINLGAISAVLVYSTVGVIMFGLSVIVLDKLTPGDFWHEIIEEHNTSLSILVGSWAIGLSMIIAAAIKG